MNESIGNKTPFCGNAPLAPITTRQLEEWVNNKIIYMQDPDTPIANDWRRRADGAFIYDERYNGTTWDIISTIGASIIIDRFIVNALDGGLFFDNPLNNERYNFVRPATTDDAMEIGDTRLQLALSANSLDDFLLGYNGSDLTESLGTVFTETLPSAEYTKTFTYSGTEVMTLLYLKLKAVTDIYEKIDIIDTVNGRVSYSTMSDAEYLSNGGRLAEDKDSGNTTGDITLSLLSVGFLIPGREYKITFCMCEGSALGAPDFPYFELVGKEQLFEVVANKTWVKDQTIFGTEFEKFESLAESSAGYAWTNKIDATTAIKPAGTYRIGYNCEITETGNSQEIRILVNGSSIHNHTTGNDELEPQIEENNWTPISGFTYLTLTTGCTIDINIQHKDSGTGKMSNAIIEIWRVS